MIPFIKKEFITFNETLYYVIEIVRMSDNPNVENLKQFCIKDTNNRNCQLVANDLEYDTSDIDQYYNKTTKLKTIDITDKQSKTLTEKKLMVEDELMTPNNTRCNNN